jgi:hypothetical protein
VLEADPVLVKREEEV